MKLSLRKANALQNAIQDHIKTIEVETSISLNEFQNPEFELAAARNQLMANDQVRYKLTRALYTIRAQVGKANSDSGVSALLADAAFIDKRLAHLRALTESTKAESMDVIKGKLRKIAEDKGDRRIYGHSDSVTTGVLTDVQIESYQSEMRVWKKEKQSINDKVLELNVRTEIELDEQLVEILTTQGLV